MTWPLTQKFDAECLLFPRHSSVSWVLPGAEGGTRNEPGDTREVAQHNTSVDLNLNLGEPG